MRPIGVITAKKSRPKTTGLTMALHVGGIDHVGEVVGMLRTLSDPTRLRLLAILQEGEQSVTALCDELQLAQPTVSHHLGRLRMARLVANRRAGKQVFYSLNSDLVCTERLAALAKRVDFFVFAWKSSNTNRLKI